MLDESDIPTQAREVLLALARRKNVLISGPPGTGKSRLLNQVRDLFVWDRGAIGASPDREIPIPPSTSPLPPWFPSAHRTHERQSFSTVFDQNTKYRDFMRGILPKVGSAGEFFVTSGTLYRASEHALGSGNASLVIIDEINRGPAVAAFGSAIVGLEADKRLGDDGTPTSTTQFFELLASDGGGVQYALPDHVYVLAAMNEADTSVEPLDVAFLRRFAPYKLEPDVAILRSHLGLAPATDDNPLPASAESPEVLYDALVRALLRLNDRISLARGAAYQLGHGGLMHRAAPSGDLNLAFEYVGEAWLTMKAHLDEVFFGDTRALSDLLAAEDPSSPYQLREELFAGQSVSRVLGPTALTSQQVYTLLRLLAGS